MLRRASKIISFTKPYFNTVEKHAKETSMLPEINQRVVSEVCNGLTFVLRCNMKSFMTAYADKPYMYVKFFNSFDL